MDATLLQKLLENPSWGWIGWLSLAAIVISVALGLITKALIQVVKNIKAIKSEVISRPDYKKQIKCENNINQIIRTMKHDLRADAVVLMQYHNGVHSIANNSLLRISATHESINANTKSYLPVIDGWMASFLGDFNNELFEGRYIEVKDVNSYEFSASERGFESWLKQAGIRSLYLYPLGDAYGHTFGIGLIIHAAHTVSHSNDMLQWAKGRFIAVGALLAGSGQVDE
jgi:hypothetical protein